ncbi:MAG: right-handed parallel beta-helix repeat-containing protein [Planctomycetota bacterium]|jgi:hypothetical protein
MRLAVLVLFAAVASAQVRVEDSAQLLAAARRAKPGQVISLAPGVYAPGVRLVGLAGEKGRPIVIEAAERGRAPLFQGGACALHLVDCRWVTLRNLTVMGCSGNGINIDDAGTIETPSQQIVLEGITVLDTGPTGNHDGIKMSGVDDFVVRKCRIAGWGGSAIDMVGCHRGVVEDCTFEGKQGFSQSNGVQMKGGSRKILVQGCFFRDAGERSVNIGGSTGLAYFRPRNARFEAEEITVAGNRFAGGTAFVAFVNARNARVHHNTMHHPAKWVLRILQETRGERFPACREGVFENNLIVFDRRLRTAVNIGPATAPKSFVLRNNAWFGVDGAPRPRCELPETDAVHGVDPKLMRPGSPKMRAASKDQRLRAVGARAHLRSNGKRD